MDYDLIPLPKREENSNKGTFGKVLNIAGCFNYSGAAYLSSLSGLRVGCGLVALAADKEVITAVSAQTPNLVYILKDDVLSVLENYTVVSIGCGLGTDKNTVKFFKTVLEKLAKLETPVVIDASGLTLLGNLKNVQLPKNLVITPHPGEAAKLLGVSVDEITTEPDKYAKILSEKFDCITVLKGHKTRVCNGKDLFINFTGNSSLAKAGSGDVLCGIISGLIAQGMKPYDACIVGVNIHGKCGELASELYSTYGVLASDLLDFIPMAILEYSKPF